MEMANEVIKLKANSPVTYIRTEPEIIDYTTYQPFKLILTFLDQSISISVDRDNKSIFALIDLIMEKGVIVFWNAKSFYTYHKYITHKNLSHNFIDLKLCERYIGIRQNAPVTYKECLDRLKKIDINFLKTIHKTVHVPLSRDVIPSIETTPVIGEKSYLYPFYEIEGQVNGRMKSYKAFEKTFNPHKDKENIRLKDKLFMYFDYKNMEVSMLAWLSKDESLLKILNEKDVYKSIYGILMNEECSEENRSLMKAIFLPVCFGQSKKGIVEENNISYDLASFLYDKIYEVFGVTLKWISEVSETDIFGRKRQVDDYRNRNFKVQSPSALVCLIKLIDLHKSINVGFSVHDGYFIYCNKNELTKTYNIVNDILEKEPDIASGLVLRTTCKVGYRLDKMKRFR